MVLALVRLVALLCVSRAPVVWSAGGSWALFGLEWLAGSVLQGNLNNCRPVRRVGWVSVGLPSLGPMPSVGPCP